MVLLCPYNTNTRINYVRFLYEDLNHVSFYFIFIIISQRKSVPWCGYVLKNSNSKFKKIL